MFRHLRTKLTFAFGGMISIILICVAVTLFFSVQHGVKTQVRKEFEAVSNVQERLWQVNAEQLAQNAETISRDFGFRSAVATQDIPTISSALESMQTRLGLDYGAVVLDDGQTVLAGRSDAVNTPDGIIDALIEIDRRSGVLSLDDVAYFSVSVPIMAPDRVGWVIFSRELGSEQMRELEALSPIDLIAAFHSGSDGSVPKAHEDRKTIGSVTEFDGFLPDTKGFLELRYPLGLAMAPYQPMFWTIALTAIAGLAIVIGGCWFISRDVTTPIMRLDKAAERLGEGQNVELEIDSKDEIGRLSESFNKMVGRIREREARITDLSLRDTETSLPNRRALHEAVVDAVTYEDPENTFVVAFGIDRLSRIRSVIGHAATNQLVNLVGLQLGALDGVHAMGRLASDTVGVLFWSTSKADLMAWLESQHFDHSRPIEVNGEAIDIQLKVGLASFDPDNRMDLIDQASVALQQARTSGKTVSAFDRIAYGDPSGTLSMMSDMVKGLEDGSVTLAYQPKYDLRDQRIKGVEALIRWTHPVRGFVSPDVFVTYAEETGHIRPLTEWVLKQAKLDRHAYLGLGHDLKISVNISGRLMADQSFIDWAIEEMKDEPTAYCFEVTETAVIDDRELALANIIRLREQGIEISIDDYGAGLSSLSYLKQLPAHELKIDKDFILAMEAGSSDALLVKSTIDLAHSLGLKVTAEGVETEAVLQLLAVMGADTAQGYFIARPGKLADIADLIRDQYSGSDKPQSSTSDQKSA